MTISIPQAPSPFLCNQAVKKREPERRLVVYDRGCPAADQVQAYGRYLSRLLETPVNSDECTSGMDASLSDLFAKAACSHDLLIFGEPTQSPVRRLLFGPAGCQVARRASMSVLIARQGRWPLKKILLVARSHTLDEAAVEWAIRLAQPSEALITVLAIVPPMPAMYQRAMTSMPNGLADWLVTDTPLGDQLRCIARRLANWERAGELHFRQGPPDRQIRDEIIAGDHDLVIIAADSCNWWSRRLLGVVIPSLLRWADRPVLVAKPMIA